MTWHMFYDWLLANWTWLCTVVGLALLFDIGNILRDRNEIARTHTNVIAPAIRSIQEAICNHSETSMGRQRERMN